ncbi:MAG: alpha/beta hydrolase [Verrucomicrobiota bacterium]
MKWILLPLLTLRLSAAEPLTLSLWPEGAPGEMKAPSAATAEFIQKRAGKSTVTNVSSPTITVYRPDKPNGTCVIVAPGGAFAFLSAVHEGTQVCEWLNTLGVTGVLLTYRTPTRDETAPHEKPVQDAQKALEIIRQHAAEWKLNPKRVGLLGFSAGGNLLAHLACDRDANVAAQRPDFGIMIYGGGFLDPADPFKLNPAFTVPADAPPMFLACASDDGNNPVAATLLYLEYKKQKRSAELHLFSAGGHGFGMRDNKQPVNAWPARCAEWLDSMGWLPTLDKLDETIYRSSKTLEMEEMAHNDHVRQRSELEALSASTQKLEEFLNTVQGEKFADRKALLLEKVAASRQKLEAVKKVLPKTSPEAEAAAILLLKEKLAELQAERDWLAKIWGSVPAEK